MRAHPKGRRHPVGKPNSHGQTVAVRQIQQSKDLWSKLPASNPPRMNKFKAAPFDPGAIGLEALKFAAEQPGMEIVGAVGHDPKK